MVVPVDKASKNIVFVCKTHYINFLMEELGMSIMTGNPTYNLTAMSKDEILRNHLSMMLTFGFSSQRKILTFPNCTGFLNFTRIRTSRDILRFPRGGGGGGGGGRGAIAPFFSKKYMIDPIFLDWYIKGPTFPIYPGTCTYFSFRDFSRLLVLLVFNELTAIFV